MFFGLSKIFWALAQPLNALCLMALLGFCLRFRWKLAGQRMMNAALTLIFCLGVFPVGPLLVTYLERQYPTPETLPPRIDGVIVLGGAFESYLTEKTGHIVANDQVDRMFCFVEIAKANPKAKMVFSGGPGDIVNPAAMEGADARAFFKLAGLNVPVIYEEKSRNTYENGLYSKELLKPAQGENWVLVTSAYHMPRSVGIFKKQGWDIIPYQCDPKTDGSYKVFSRLPNVTGNFYMLNIAVKELIGMVVYQVTGKAEF